MKSSLLLVLVSAFFILIGCSSENNADIVLIASEKSLPEHKEFDRIAYQREQVPYFKYLVKKVSNQSQYEKNWNFFGMQQKLPDVNLFEKDILFIGLRESGSCPVDLGDVKINLEKQEMMIQLKGPGGPCTSDATPRTFVIAVDKNNSQELKNVIIIEGRTETTVPIIDD